MQDMNRLLLLAIALLVIGVAAIALVLLSSPADLQARADDILRDLSAGHYEAVWNASSEEFRARYPLDRFQTVMADFHGTMGPFQRIVQARSSDAAADGQASGALLREGLGFELQYEKGRAFCYIVLDDEAAPPQLRELLLRRSS